MGRRPERFLDSKSWICSLKHQPNTTRGEVVVEKTLETKVPNKRQIIDLVNSRKQGAYMGRSTEETIPRPELVYIMQSTGGNN